MKTNIRIVIRNIISFKLYSGLNILGLGLGLTAVFFIFFWIYNESSYDKYNTNYNQIYQINYQTTDDGHRWSTTPSPLAPALADHVAAIETVSRIRRCATFAFKSGENMFLEEYGATADPELFDIFTFKVLSGNPKEALNTVENIVVTESFAKRYFGNKSALDQQLNLEGEGIVTIKAVIEDLPTNSHLKFDYLLSHKFAEQYRLCGLGWGDPNFLTYIKVTKEADITDVHSAITQVAMQNKVPQIFYGSNIFNLRPLSGIYLDHDIPNRIGESGDKRNILIFGTVGILILLLACINYINLSISLFTKRQRNTSIQKICGAFRTNIFARYLMETLVVILVSLLLALVLVFILEPLFVSVVGKSVKINFLQPDILAFMAILLLGCVLLCGVYPALLISNMNPLILVDKFSLRKSKNRGLKVMVAMQNVISILLIICTIGILKQMNFVRSKELGFDSEKIVYVRLRGQIPQKIEAAKHEILALSGVSQVAMKDCPPFDSRNNTVGIIWKDEGEIKNTGNNTKVGSETTRIDDEYFKMTGVEFAQGRNFDKTISSDKKNYILNEEAVRQMRLADPIGAEFALYGRWGTIIGVIKDTHFKSLHQKVEPQVYWMFQDLEKESYFSVLNIKLSGEEFQKTIMEVENIWIKFNPGIPFSYHFLDEKYEALYVADKQVAGMVKIFSLLAVLIACLGLLGQSVLATENRIKEIGIRKVNGAKISEILSMLNKDFIKWVAIAFVIASPIAYYAMNLWLENFAYKTTLSWWIFALAGVLALGIALLTVSWQSWRAATRNPVEALRYE
ncbi:MAG: FtsX-like permease family protein [Prolixibacteraceae bacterium]|jgi:putative ABC transport system permease protein|nr:FtsX-like permease family protein [Prolixibacteraceae bacterium]MBT6766955.1 FtsX-like permease family protein [Prolixibacteraceae bacterium]MBT6997977.1 FtsX-like permease family protein [Prolixibacteraceae bacterium]MBT7396013.1 FtsX-like permease family protein [Prolixibacteraceae bacterium]